MWVVSCFYVWFLFASRCLVCCHLFSLPCLVIFLHFFFYWHANTLFLHTFPTRCSTDLPASEIGLSGFLVSRLLLTRLPLEFGLRDKIGSAHVWTSLTPRMPSFDWKKNKHISYYTSPLANAVIRINKTLSQPTKPQTQSPSKHTKHH